MRQPEIVPELRTAPCRFLLREWHALRGDRLLARRADIDPTRFAGFLSHVGLFEVRSPDMTICVLAGTAFQISLGFELTGRNVVDIYAPELHRAASYRFFMMATRPCGATLELPLRFLSGTPNPHEILLLPLEPKYIGAPRPLLVAIAAVDAVTWENKAVLPHPKPSPSFRFIDVGAGVPASTLPAADVNERFRHAPFLGRG